MKNFAIPTLDKPDAEKLSEYLNSSIESFASVTGISVTYFNWNNEIVKEFKADDKLCNIFDVYKTDDSPCRKCLASAGRFASRLGEPYIFLCRAGLANIAISLIIDETFVGYFIAGPIVKDQLKSETISNFASLNNLTESEATIAKMLANKMWVYQSHQISHIALLFYNCIITSVSANNSYSTLRNQYSQQNQSNSEIETYKKEHVSIEYPYDLEKVLIDNVNNGQTTLAKENLEKMLNSFSTIEKGNLEGIKSKVLWFFAIIIRIANESENNFGQIVDTDLDIINKLNEVTSFAQLLAVSTNIIQLITKNMLSSIYNGKSQIVSKALQYINKNYNDKISLKDIEANLHVNASYFSTLFKQEMGVTFTDYMNSLKIQRACGLLTNTNLSIIDVSLSTGFDDQSYFTKVFKKTKGVTPKEYRSSHSAT